MDIPVNDHLRLTAVFESDKAALVKYLNDKSIYQNTLTIPYPFTLESAEIFLEKLRSKEEKDGLQNSWAIRKEDGELIGKIGLLFNYGKNSHKDEIGYWLARPFRKQGLMSEVLSCFIDFCIQQRNLKRIEAKVFEHNRASARLLEKSGFQKEGVLRKDIRKNGVFYNSVLYALVRED